MLYVTLPLLLHHALPSGKKAEAIAQAASANKKMKVQLPLPHSDSISNTSNNVSLARLASAAETKNEVSKRLDLAVEAKKGIA